MRSWLGLLSVAAVTMVLACGGDEVAAPSPPDVAGAYSATSFTTTTNGVVTDQLAEGVTFAITLAPDGTTAGSLAILGGSMDMAGRWALAGSIVTFDQAADTFVRQMSFRVSPNHLQGEGTFGGTTIRVTLAK